MTSSGGGSDHGPVDPDYASLFRPIEDPPAVDEPMFESIVDPVIDPREEESRGEELAEEQAEEQEPQAPSHADTGRLFRSQGVTGRDDAVLALASDHFGRLRTLRRSETPEPIVAPAPPDAIVVDDAGPAVPADDLGVNVGVNVQAAAAVEEVPVTRRARRRAAADSHRSRQITGGAVYLIVIGVTLIVGFINAWLSDGDLGWPTGLALAVSTVYAALTVRRQDDVVAIIVPPLAFLAAALTAGQLFLGAADASILNRAVVVFFTLADNWPWIIGSTLAALVIVLVRRRRP